MTVIYKCSECGKVIDKIEAEGIDKQSLGINILTEEERKDIIETQEDNLQINITCDQCARQAGWNQLYNANIH